MLSAITKEAAGKEQMEFVVFQGYTVSQSSSGQSFYLILA